MIDVRGEPDFVHGEVPAVGVLLANLGTPEAPTAEALRPYLRQFLSDPRVIELPRWQWLPILYLFVLTFRPRRSAALYRKIWTDEGSPLLVMARRQAAGIAKRLAGTTREPLHVALGMRYGNPSLASALRELQSRGCRKILYFPLYPQYSATTTASTFDALAEELASWRWIPEIRTIHSYHDEPGYIRALAASIRERWEAEGEAERLVFSFHGIPQRYFDAGDPYFCHCQKTGRLIAEELGLPPGRAIVSFQSLFGREEWIKPTTDVTIRAMARSGVESLDVLCPGFAADCLETLEEIDVQNREFFLDAGGKRFRFVPCLNDRADHLDFLADLVRRNLAGWVEPMDHAAADADRREAAASRERAETMRADPPRADAGFGSAPRS